MGLRQGQVLQPVATCRRRRRGGWRGDPHHCGGGVRRWWVADRQWRRYGGVGRSAGRLGRRPAARRPGPGHEEPQRGQPRRAERHHTLRLVAGDHPRAEPLRHQLADQGHTRGPADEEDGRQIVHLHAGVEDGLLHQIDRALDVVDDHRLELAAVDDDVAVGDGHEHLGGGVRREGLLGPPGLHQEVQGGPLPLAVLTGHHLVPEFLVHLGEALAEVAEQAVVEVLAADVLVAARHADHLEPAGGALQERGVEGAAAQVVDAHVGAHLHVFAGVVDGGGDRLVDQFHLLQAGPLGGLHQCLAPYTGPAHRVGDDAARGGLPVAQAALGDDGADDRRRRIAGIHRLAAQQQRRRRAQRPLRGALQAIRMHAGQVVGGGAHGELAVGGEEDHRGDPAIAFDLQRGHRRRHDRCHLAARMVGGEAPWVQFADGTGGSGRPEVDPDGPAHSAPSDPVSRIALL